MAKEPETPEAKKIREKAEAEAQKEAERRAREQAAQEQERASALTRRQVLVDERQDVINNHKPAGSEYSPAELRSLKRLEGELNDLDIKLHGLTGQRYNWRKGVTPHP